MKKRKVNKMVAWILIFAMGLVNISTLTNSYADEVEEPFVITDTTFADNNATVTWNYTYKSGTPSSYTLDTNMKLEQEANGSIVSAEGTIGSYTISRKGNFL